MDFGICNISIASLRKEPFHESELVNQVLFGETFQIIEELKHWSKIKLTFDGYEAYVQNLQFAKISENLYKDINETKSVFSGEIIDYVLNDNELFTIPLGAKLPFFSERNFKLESHNLRYEGKTIDKSLSKEELINNAYIYLNTPYLWGGKSPFGIDCSGFTQMVYKLCGHQIPRDAKDQAKIGEVLSFIEESEPGDLAFFDDENGEIIHVGIILNDYSIIHAHGIVRVDTLDHSGIYNSDLQTHTHKLRVIKKII